MTLRMIVASALLVSCLHARAAQEMGLMVAMEVQQDGQTLAKPKIWQPSGTAGEISIKNEFRLKVTPTLTDDKAEVAFEIFTTQDGIESKVGSPRVATKVGGRASIAWNAASGKSYKLLLLVSETVKPGR